MSEAKRISRFSELQRPLGYLVVVQVALLTLTAMMGGAMEWFRLLSFDGGNFA